MLVLDGGKGLMLGYWLGQEVNSRSRAPDCGPLANQLMWLDPNTGSPGGSDSKACVQCGSYCTGQLGLSCQTLCDLTDCSLTGSSIHGHWIQNQREDFWRWNSCLLPYSQALKIPRTEEPRGLQYLSHKSWTYRKMCFREERKWNTWMPTICQALGCEHSI